MSTRLGLTRNKNLQLASNIVVEVTTDGSPLQHVLSLLRDQPRTIVDESDGRVRETWTLMGRVAGKITTRNVQAAISNIQRYFAQLRTDSTLRLYQFEASESEIEIKFARVYSGSLAVADGDILDRGLHRGKIVLSITFVRDRYMEFGIDALKVEDVLSTGHTFALHTNSSGVAPGRIARFEVGADYQRGWPNGTSFTSVWAGIKPDLGGIDISPFNGRINANPHWVIPAGGTARIIEAGTNSQYVNNDFIYTNYDIDPSNILRFIIGIRNWNTSTAGTNPLESFIGRYHLLMRYVVRIGKPESNELTSVSKQVRIGVQGVSLWGTSPARHSTERRLPYQEIKVEEDKDLFKMIDLGVIDIATDWARTPNHNIANYSVGLMSGIVGATKAEQNAVNLEVDQFYLVPADHFVHALFPGFVDQTKHGLVATDEMGIVQAFVAPGTVPQTGTAGLERQSIFIESNNWSMPAGGTPRAVVAVESTTGSLTVSNKLIVYFENNLRTEVYS